MEIKNTVEKLWVGNVDMTGSRFQDVNLAGCEFDDVTLENAQFNNISLRNAQFTDCDIEGLCINGILISELLH